jgi:hypothetical protein
MLHFDLILVYSKFLITYRGLEMVFSKLQAKKLESLNQFTWVEHSTSRDTAIISLNVSVSLNRDFKIGFDFLILFHVETSLSKVRKEVNQANVK